jgi:hypothetical protein
MQRPNNGAVADNGSFCLEDWHLGSSLSGTFGVFDSAGNPIVTKELTANIFGMWYLEKWKARVLRHCE